MLGRHVYRVHSENESWAIAKEGAASPCGRFRSKQEAVTAASRLAEQDQPSRVVVDNGDGIILEELLFGSDLSQELNETAQ